MEVLVLLYGRIVDLNYFPKLFSIQQPYSRVVLRSRLGWLRTFDPVGGSYTCLFKYTSILN